MPHPGEIWIMSGIGLLMLEIAAPGAFMMWLGVAALGTGLVALAMDPAFAVQVMVFAVLAAVAILVALRLRRRPVARINMPGSGLIGRTAVALSFEGREGRVRVGGSDWPARLARGCPEAEPGWMLEVAEVDGMVLVVRKKSFDATQDPAKAER